MRRRRDPKWRNLLAEPRPCAACGKRFRPRLAQLDDGAGLYCSRQCYAGAREPERKRKHWGITFNGETLTMNEWADRLGISRISLIWRLKHGWTLEKALTEPRGVTGPRSKSRSATPSVPPT